MTNDPYFLTTGPHEIRDQGWCYNEMLSCLAGEPFSSQPKCVSPVIRGFTMELNDRLADGPRQRLWMFALRSLGTAGDGRDHERGQLCLHWLVREGVPTLLDAAGETEEAKRLRELPDELAVENVRRTLDEVRERAYEASRSALARLHAKYPAADAALAAHHRATYGAAATHAAAEAVAAAHGYVGDAAPTNPDAAAAAAVAAADAADATAAQATVAAADAAYVLRPSKPQLDDSAFTAAEARLTEIRDRLTDRGFELLDQMLPTEPRLLNARRSHNRSRTEPAMRHKPIYRQGDVLIQAVDEIPADLQSVPRDNGRVILAYGEVTGHAHAVKGDVELLEQSISAEDLEEMRDRFLHVESEATVVHEEHDIITLPPGDYAVRRQREYAPEDIRRVAD